MNNYLEQTIEAFRSNRSRYARYERYYLGNHELSFATDKFANAFGSQFREFAMNLCPAVCDAVKDKLKIARFAVSSSNRDSSAPKSTTSLTADSDEISTRLERVWHANRMPLRSGEVHKEALKNGDSYVIVWPDASGRAGIFPNRSDSVVVHYDGEAAGQMTGAAKIWRDAENKTRINLFFPDRIEKYISSRPVEGLLPEGAEFTPFTEKGRRIGKGAEGVVPNPFGRVPVFHFANNADLGSMGRSELQDAIPIQDGLNKSVLDMLVAMEFSAYRQRWAAGIELEFDADGKAIAPFKAGIDHIWIAQDPNSRFGDFETAALDQFLKVKDSFRIDIASVTGTPLHYLMPHMRGQPSGETLRRSETRFIAKVRDRQAAFGQTWAEVMNFAMRIEGFDNLDSRTMWEDPSPSSDRERLENILLKRKIGLPAEQALAEAGY
ncbi:MAG TPA: phage portal protein [Pyrinomonadaceae bacterium]|nr:phage portal protein [Pyrinomonadaceae bacterium]